MYVIKLINYNLSIYIKNVFHSQKETIRVIWFKCFFMKFNKVSSNIYISLLPLKLLIKLCNDESIKYILSCR